MTISSAVFVKGVRGTDPILYDGLPQVAFIGRSNVGKSSIINALLGKKDLVKVSDRPGKTTEINFFKVNDALYCVDLPGYGYAKVGPEGREKLKKMIHWYIANSDVRPRVVVLILDVKAGFTEFDREVLALLREKDHPYLLVVNKIDKLNQRDLQTQLRQITDESNEAEIVLSSTVTKGGIDALRERLFV